MIGYLQLSTNGVTFPDERQYIDLAAAVAAGRSANSYHPGYGQRLYNSTRPFSATLARLFDVFGPGRWPGQMLAALCGVAVAVLTVFIARSLRLSANAVLLAGGIVALLPSQVLWSSAVLRESMIWLGITLAAYGVISMPLATGRRVWASSVSSAFGLLLLCGLRPQTAVVTTVAFVGALIVTCRHRLRLVAGGLVLAAIAPLVWGLGIFGAGFVVDNLSGTAATRARLAADAETAIVDTSSVDDGAALTIRDGLVAIALRPLPGERATSIGNRLAQGEAIAWITLYTAAPFGVVLLWRRNGLHRAVPSAARGWYLRKYARSHRGISAQHFAIERRLCGLLQSWRELGLIGWPHGAGAARPSFVPNAESRLPEVGDDSSTDPADVALAALTTRHGLSGSRGTDVSRTADAHKPATRSAVKK